MPDLPNQPFPEFSGPPLPFGVPAEIAGYRIQRVLGSGGMATVYAALQKQPRRTVALKVIKAGHSTETSLRRFKREIEILGKLHHPYIAQVYDAGSFDPGHGMEPMPFLVMEYIAGARTLLEYCAAKELDRREKLKLFVKVCAAVEHGHRNKVIHRDLKPANILIDQFGEPKVIDFGVAHTTHADLAGQTMHTEAGKIVGTLQYMAPEQVDSTLVDLDGRCDVYGLGVVLYKLLTGKTPLDLEALPVYEAVRMIKEQSPLPPSDHQPDLKGDLETIILKAVEKDRSRRYRNAGSLGRDIVRYLANKPINARRASLLHRARLFAARNRTFLTVMLVIAIVMGAAMSYVLWERSRSAERQRARDAESIKQQGELAQAQEALRDRQQNPATMPAVVAVRQAFTLKAHTARINAVHWVGSGDTGMIATASDDHLVILWDAVTDEPTHRIDGLRSAARKMSVSPDGRWLLAATSDGDLHLIDATNGTIIDRIRTQSDELLALAVDNTGNQIAWAGRELTWQLRQREAGTTLTERSGSGAFTHLLFSADGETLLACTERGVIERWNTADGSSLGKAGDAHDIIMRMALNETTHKVVAIAESGEAFRFPIDSTEPTTFSALPADPTIATIDSTGMYLALAKPGEAAVWDIATGQRRGRLIELSSEESITALAVDPSGQWIAVGQLNGDVRVIPLLSP